MPNRVRDEGKNGAGGFARQENASRHPFSGDGKESLKASISSQGK
jgi:hypothetical protein